MALDASAANWDLLQFTCTEEQNPPVDPEADVWFKRARALEKQEDERNDAEMVRLYEQAAERNHHKALVNLASLYVHGTGVPLDRSKAVDLMERALKLESPHAYYLMGVTLEQGIGVKKDKAASLAYFRRSADLGNRYGLYAAGYELFAAFAQQPEPDKSRGDAIATQMLECSMQKGYAESGYELGMHYLHGVDNQDIGRALPYFQQAAALGHSQSLYMLYSTFLEGKYGLDKDPIRAACYNRMRSEQDEERGKAFPDIDQRCPLPPPPATEVQSGQPAPRIGLWRGRDDEGVFYRVSERGVPMPSFQDKTVHWKWLATEPQGAKARSGDPCPWPGAWACGDIPSGAVLMIHGQYFPKVGDRDVTWPLVRAS